MSVDRRSIWPFQDGDPGEFSYAREAHPTGVEAEWKLGELEGGRALLFSSGMAAATAILFALLRPGQAVALAEGGYFGTEILMQDVLGPWGLESVPFDQTGAPPESVDLIWLEAPSNPFLTMPDLEAAGAHPAKVVVDSTGATPVSVSPYGGGAEAGPDSATHFLTVH